MDENTKLSVFVMFGVEVAAAAAAALVAWMFESAPLSPMLRAVGSVAL